MTARGVAGPHDGGARSRTRRTSTSRRVLAFERTVGPAGTSGQLITLVTECDFVTLGPSFEAALARWVEALESGAWTVDAARGATHPAGVAPFLAHPAEQFAAGS